jgi:hypothetical protein
MLQIINVCLQAFKRRKVIITDSECIWKHAKGLMIVIRTAVKCFSFFSDPCQLGHFSSHPFLVNNVNAENTIIAQQFNQLHFCSSVSSTKGTATLNPHLVASCSLLAQCTQIVTDLHCNVTLFANNGTCVLYAQKYYATAADRCTSTAHLKTGLVTWLSQF